VQTVCEESFYLDDYLDEFTFRYNCPRSKSRGNVLVRLAQQAVNAGPVTIYEIIHADIAVKHNMLGLDG